MKAEWMWMGGNMVCMNLPTGCLLGCLRASLELGVNGEIAGHVREVQFIPGVNVAWDAEGHVDSAHVIPAPGFEPPKRFFDEPLPERMGGE